MMRLTSSDQEGTESTESPQVTQASSVEAADWRNISKRCNEMAVQLSGVEAPLFKIFKNLTEWHFFAGS